MADEEIQISELEFRENLSGDDLLPVETSTDTFATSLTKIKDWLKSFFVSKTDNETISGEKTFTNKMDIRTPDQYSYQLHQTNIERGIAPTANKISFLNVSNDKVNKRLGGILNEYTTNMQNSIAMVVYKGISDDPTDYTNERITVGYRSDGGVYTYAPPSAFIGSIVTTTGISKEQNGYVKLGNGLIVQWGKGSGTTTITFPTPFSSGNYGISVINIGPAGTAYPAYKYQNSTTTTVNINASSSGDFRWLAIGY